MATQAAAVREMGKVKGAAAPPGQGAASAVRGTGPAAGTATSAKSAAASCSNWPAN